LKIRYRQTVLGIGWALVQPVSMMVIFTVFFSTVRGIASTSAVPYPVFLLSGLVLWQMALRVLSEGSNSVSANAALLNRVYFPRAYFPISTALTSLLDLLFGLLALAALMLWFGVPLGPEVAATPIFIAVGLASALGIAFWLSALNARYHDVAVMLPFLTQLWFFSSPIFYPSTIIPEQFQLLYALNPMVLAVDGMRWSLVGGHPLGTWEWVGLVSAAVLLISGYLFFRSRETTLADYL
jgi:lipopolysaccharide transport system permease protein